jgi:hypothetical protein
MGASFSETLVEHTAIRRELTRRAFAMAGEMHETSIKTREVITGSRDALAQADLLLGRTQRVRDQNRR